MPSLKEIRRRIKSVENIKQITKSMEMVAAAKLQRALTKAELSLSFLTEMRKILSDLLAFERDNQHPFFLQRKPATTAIIVAGADRGLCGSYNVTLFSTLDKFLKDFPQDRVELILFGRKAVEYYKKKKWTIAKSFPDWQGKASAEINEILVREIIQDFNTGKYSHIRLVYTQYETIFSRKVLNLPWLPIEKSKKTVVKGDFIIEPNEEEVLAELLPRYCLAEIQNMLNQSFACELAARVCAMSAATKNAEKMIDTLILTRNKVRQAGITKEMVEIAIGAEAMK